MGIRKYKPTTPGRRGSSVSDFAEITRSTPEKSLVRPRPGRGGRNGPGKVTPPPPGATTRAGSPPGTRAAVTSGPTD